MAASRHVVTPLRPGRGVQVHWRVDRLAPRRGHAATVEGERDGGAR